jgi:hypothetical protein
MILWVESLFCLDQETPGSEGQIFPINIVTEDDPLVISFLGSGEGTPVLRTGERDYKLVPDEVLSHCIALIDDQGQSLRVSEGIKRKLQTLALNWNMKTI